LGPDRRCNEPAAPTFYVELDGSCSRAGAVPESGDVVVGLLGTLLVLEFARRTAGLALPIVAGVFIL
jgi:TRAP-type uncharacterized transport system fused permease subunit